MRVSGFHREVDEDSVIVGYCAASSGNSLLTFRDNLSVLSSGAKKMGPFGFPETSTRNYHYWLRNDPEECSSQYINDEIKNKIVDNLARTVKS